MVPKSRPWFNFKPRSQAAQLRLFCFPYAGGGASIYRTWPGEVPESIEVVAVQPPGRENRLIEKPFKRMEALADAATEAILPHLDACPFAFFGHSLGALMAYEIAQRLTTEHGKPPLHLMTSARRPPHVPPSRPPIHHLPHDEFLSELRELDGTPEEALAHEELMELLVPLLRADFEVFETYEDRPRPALSCPITTFGGLKDEDLPREDLAEWQRYGNGSFRLRMFPGDHFFLQGPDRLPLIQAVVRDLAPYI